MGYPRSNGRGYQSGSFGVSDHGALTGLADDDHAQYTLTDGTRVITGAQSVSASGAATAPALAVGGTAAGIWEPAANNLGFAATDEYRWYFAANPWVYLDGTGFYPDATRDLDLGLTTKRWQNLFLEQFFFRSVTATITASTTQTQGQGALTTEVNEISVCATANDTVTLPVAIAGKACLVINNGAQTLQVFPASGDNLGAGVDTATTIVAGSRKYFVAFDSTNWEPVI